MEDTPLNPHGMVIYDPETIRCDTILVRGQHHGDKRRLPLLASTACKSVIFEDESKTTESQALYGEATNEEIRLTGGVCPNERRSPGRCLALRLRAYETQGLDMLGEMPFRD